MLHINDVTYRLGARLLFDHTSVALPPDGRIGFVGRNGTGKTTLFRMIQGELSGESGSITIGRGMRIGSVAQEAPSGPETLLEVVLARMSAALEAGESVKISGFGTFSVRQKGRRIGRNPKTGVEVPILPRRVLVFRPSQVLRAHVNHMAPPVGGDDE